MRSVAPRHVRKRDVNEEPGAGELHAGICEGGRQATGVPASIKGSNEWGFESFTNCTTRSRLLSTGGD